MPFIQVSTHTNILRVDSRERAAVDALGLGLYEHACAIGRKDVTVEAVNFLAHGVADVKQVAQELASLERIAVDTLAVIAYACVGVGTFNGVYSVHGLGRKLATCYVGNGYLATCRHMCC